MSGLQPNDSAARHQKLKDFLSKWPMERLKSMTLEEYTDVGNHNTFCYWVEFETEPLGRIGGRPSNKFGVWKRNTGKPIKSTDFDTDGTYAWVVRYGNTAEQAFEALKVQVVSIAESALSGDFKAIDGIKYDNLVKWKIAFLYSDCKLMPIYKKDSIRKIAKRFEHPNYEKARFSELHQFILDKKPKGEDIFDFAYREFFLSKKDFARNYYVIGSKYEDDEGNDTVSIVPQMLERNVIATGWLWGQDFSHLYGHSRQKIESWCDKNIKDQTEKYTTARRTLGIFLTLKPGDLVAVKSKGNFSRLTIVAYAQVKEVDKLVYEHDEAGLGHIIHVEFLEAGLEVDTGLNYAKTIHQITPGAKEGHFEKIFGSYASLESTASSETLDSDEGDGAEPLEEDRINEKNTESMIRTVSYSAIISQTHNKIQNAFAKNLKEQFPDDVVRTESNYVDVKRENATDIFLYEVKPFNSAYRCIREGIGQLLDYSFSLKNSEKQVHLIIVGMVKPNDHDKKFIKFVKKGLNLPFEYIAIENSNLV